MKNVSIYMQGLNHLKSDDAESAKECFSKVIEQDPAASFAHHYLGEAFFALAQIGDAQASFSRALVLNPQFAVTLLYLGQIAEMNGDPSKRDEFFEAARRLAGNTSDDLKQMAKTLARIGSEDREFAFELLLAAHREQPDDLEVCLMIAEADPPNAAAFARFGEQLAATGDLDRAVIFSYLAAHLRPRERKYWSRLADILQSAGEAASAEICRLRAE